VIDSSDFFLWGKLLKKVLSMGFGVDFAIFEFLITEINDKRELISFLSPH
jgi:hypothetical protein